MAVILRSIPTKKYKNYRSYKKILRKDFKYQCAYCGHHEGEPYAGDQKRFEIDHFKPKDPKMFPELTTVYTNLYYCCKDCNLSKSNTWPSIEEEKLGYRILDPCVDDYELHFGPDFKMRRILKGQGELQNLAADYTIDTLGLNDRRCVVVRELRAGVRALNSRLNEILDKIHLYNTGKSKISADIRPLIQELDPLVRELQDKQAWINPQPREDSNE